MINKRRVPRQLSVFISDIEDENMLNQLEDFGCVVEELNLPVTKVTFPNNTVIGERMYAYEEADKRLLDITYTPYILNFGIVILYTRTVIRDPKTEKAIGYHSTIEFDVKNMMNFENILFPYAA